MTKTDSKDAVGSAIAKTIESAFSLSQEPNGEKVGKFIEELATNGLDAVLGSGSASEDQYKQYIIYPDKDFYVAVIFGIGVIVSNRKAFKKN